MEKLDFLDTEEPTEDTTVEPQTEAQQTEPSPVTETAEPSEAKPDRVRGPDGKFAAKPKDEDIMVPLKALHETRDEVRDLKARLAQFELPQQPQQAPLVPDMFEDPDGYTAWQNQQMSRAIYAERYNFSQRLAEQQHGKETVQSAVNWAAERAANDPQFNMAALSQPDPVGFAIEQWKKDQIVSQVDANEYEQFKQWKAATAATQQQAPPGQTTTQNPPQSIASLPSGGGGAGHVPSGPGVAFDNLF